MKVIQAIRIDRANISPKRSALAKRQPSSYRMTRQSTSMLEPRLPKWRARSRCGLESKDCDSERSRTLSISVQSSPPFPELAFTNSEARSIRWSLAATGSEVVKEIRHMSFDVSMGVTGVDLTEGFTNSSHVEVEVKRAVCAQARKVWVVADGSKWADVSFYRVADLSAAHGSIIDTALQSDEISALKATGLRLMVP